MKLVMCVEQLVSEVFLFCVFNVLLGNDCYVVILDPAFVIRCSCHDMLDIN